MVQAGPRAAYYRFEDNAIVALVNKNAEEEIIKQDRRESFTHILIYVS